jgi:5-methylcytosine-specific restriction protein A
MRKRACIVCGQLTASGSRCAKHSRNEGWTAYAARNPGRAAFYRSATWRDMRRHHLSQNPACVVCGAPASHADHITPLAEGGATTGPLQSLCEGHHRQKTTAEGHRGMKRKAERSHR